MVADDLGDQSQAEAAAGRLGGDERLKQMGAHIIRDTRPVVAHRHEQRQVDAGARSRHRDPHAMLKPGGQRDLGMRDPRLGDGLGRVLYQIEDHLDQLVAVAPNRRQRRIIGFDKADARREAGMCQPPHMLQHPMDVHRRTGDRLLADCLHPVDKIPDTVGLIPDQFR